MFHLASHLANLFLNIPGSWWPVYKKCFPHFVKRSDSLHNTPSRWPCHHENITGRMGIVKWKCWDGSCDWDESQEEQKPTRHGRLHKLVREGSSRVWEATTTVFSGSTRVSRSLRSRYENVYEWRGQNVPPSVIFGPLSIKVSVENKATSTTLHYMMSWMLHHRFFHSSLQIIGETTAISMHITAFRDCILQLRWTILCYKCERTRVSVEMRSWCFVSDWHIVFKLP